MLCMLCYVCKDSQTAAYMKHVGTSQFWFLKLLLQLNSNILEKKQKQKQTNKMKILCHIIDIKIAWINTCKIYIKSSDVSATRRFFINQLFV